MEVFTEKKRVTLTYQRLKLDDGFVFSDVHALIELLEDLIDADGLFIKIVMNGGDWAKKLEELEVVSKNARGSYGHGKKYREFYNQVYVTLYGEPRFGDDK